MKCTRPSSRRAREGSSEVMLLVIFLSASSTRSNAAWYFSALCGAVGKLYCICVCVLKPVTERGKSERGECPVNQTAETIADSQGSGSWLGKLGHGDEAPPTIDVCIHGGNEPVADRQENLVYQKLTYLSIGKEGSEVLPCLPSPLIRSPSGRGPLS